MDEERISEAILQNALEAKNKAMTDEIINLIKEVWGKGIFRSECKILTELFKRGVIDKNRNPFQEVLDFLRTCIKHQELDLEATRRELAYYKRISEGKK